MPPFSTISLVRIIPRNRLTSQMLNFFGFSETPISETSKYHAGKEYESRLLASGRANKSDDASMAVYDVDVNMGEKCTKEWIHTVEVSKKR